MAVTVSMKKRTKFMDTPVVIADVAFNGGYSVGGEEVKPRSVGFNSFYFVLPSTADGYTFEFDHDNNKLKAYVTGDTADSPGNEVAGSTDLTGVTVRVLAIGL